MNPRRDADVIATVIESLVRAAVTLDPTGRGVQVTDARFQLAARMQEIVGWLVTDLRSDLWKTR